MKHQKLVAAAGVALLLFVAQAAWAADGAPQPDARGADLAATTDAQPAADSASGPAAIPVAPVALQLPEPAAAPGADSPATGVEATAGEPTADTMGSVQVDAAEGEQEPASTAELLNEDDRLEGTDAHGAEGTEAERMETVEQEAAPDPDPAGETALGTESAAESEAAAVSVDPGDSADSADSSDLATPLSDEESFAGELFPTSPGIEKQKAFWIRIFTHYDSRQGVLHDGRIALPVYAELDLNGMKYRAQRRYVRDRKRELATALRELAASTEAGASLTPEQLALKAKLPADAGPEAMRDFAHNVRFQRGLSDRFRDGLVASGALFEHMKELLARHGVPADLMYLPHVESSFNNTTLSKYGAAGIWQFTRRTGRVYMTVGYEVDERLDPVIATEAAAKFLRQNFERLGTWPLAITAYNHGPRSLERIARSMGTSDLGVLIEQYDGKLFKFASKNFYAEFLAARAVAQQPERYFEDLEFAPTLAFTAVKLPWHVDPAAIADALDIDTKALRALNPAVRDTVWSGAKFIPPGYHLRIPPEQDGQALLAAIPEDQRYAHQKRSQTIRVVRGDTLYGIGRRHGIRWQSIALANNIDSARRLRPGQKLILPWNGVNPPQAVAAREGRASEGAPAASPPAASSKLAGVVVVERIAVEAGAPRQASTPGSALPEAQADQFQELQFVTVSATRKEGEIVAAYGETVGAYSHWAGVTEAELRQINNLSRRSVLRPGQHYVIPLDAVTPAQFEAQRLAYHWEREQSFFAEYDIKEKVKIEVRQGQSPWNLAQDNNVPMWLFYRENPELLTRSLQVGMEVILPVVQAGGGTAATP